MVDPTEFSNWAAEITDQARRQSLVAQYALIFAALDLTAIADEALIRRSQRIPLGPPSHGLRRVRQEVRLLPTVEELIENEADLLDEALIQHLKHLFTSYRHHVMVGEQEAERLERAEQAKQAQRLEEMNQRLPKRWPDKVTRTGWHATAPNTPSPDSPNE